MSPLVGGAGARSDGGALRVAVIAGGPSSEHGVSLSSGSSVRDGLLAGGHEVVWVIIGRDGVWRRDGEGEPLSVSPGGGLLEADVAFPVLHGPYGEDGTVQGLLETLGVPYVGAGVAASAMCLDKVTFKEIMSVAGVPQVDYRGLRAASLRDSPETVLAELEPLGLPVFVKPAHFGSSLGIVKVSSSAELPAALAGAFEHDRRVIVEAMARGVEVECGVLELPLEDGEEALASQPGEIVFAGDWYDYTAKYTSGGMELLIPARISPSAAARVRELALAAFARVGCAGLARVDFFVDGETVLLNELNTMPGFTPTSVYGKLLDASGIPYTELLERLCLIALERRRREPAAGGAARAT
jgi:D-alanine-D-alanine ligase